MSDVLSDFDRFLKDGGPAAIILREHLMPVEGYDGVLFPATFAASEDRSFTGGYNIDEFADGHNVCLIDSVGSEANRIEPLFAMNGYASLVPQIVVRAGSKRVNLLFAGHRAGDAIVRCSSLKEELRTAFNAVLNGNPEPLAKIAPTSIVFGAWDSRDTQAKLPRLISSTIRAFDVRKLTRSAQFTPATDYVEQGLLPEATEKAIQDAYAQRGFVHVPASGSHGGVIATGGIRRDATLHLAALRLLGPNEDGERRSKLLRYILGLALTAFTYSPVGYLRQGCNLVLDPQKGREMKEVYVDGQREDAALTHSEAIAYAKAAAKAFGINLARQSGTAPDREVDFDRELAKTDITTDGSSGVKVKKGAKAAK